MDRAAAQPRRASIRLIALVPILLFLAIAAWTVASPVGSAPGERTTLTNVWCSLGDRSGLCADGSSDTPQVPKQVATADCFAGSPRITANCQDLTGGLTPATGIAQAYESPKLYAAVAGLLASHSVEASVIAIRLLNVLLFMGIGTVVFVLLSPRRRMNMVLTWFVVLTPLGIFTVASAASLSWVVTGCTTAWFATLGAVESTGRRKTVLGVLAVIGVALASAGGLSFGLIAAMAAATALICADRAEHPADRRPLMRVATCVIVAAALIVVIAGPAASRTWQNGLPLGTHAAGAGLLINNLLSTPSLWFGAFGAGPRGADAWTSFSPPYVAQASGIAIFIGLLTVGLFRPSRRRVAALTAWVAVLLFWPALILQGMHDAIGNRIEPQQLFPALIILVAVATSVGASAHTLTRSQLVFIGIGSVAATVTTLYMLIRRFTVADPYDFRFDFGQSVAWWWRGLPVGPMPIWVLGALAFAAAVIMIAFYLARFTGSGSRQSGPRSAQRRQRIGTGFRPPTAPRPRRIEAGQ